VTVYDEGGSYEVGSITEGRAVASGSRHQVKRVRLSIQETVSRRSVQADTLGMYGCLWVYGPTEAEVIGLAGLLDEVLKAHTPSSEARRSLWRRLRLWWRTSDLKTRLFVEVAGGLIVVAIVALSSFLR